MDLGAKLKDARAAAGLTQGEAAEKLYVSRQTISNWENGKTYPDIVSVVKMSDLYGISLDRLLKEEKSMEENKNSGAGGVSDYVTYLKENANAVKNGKKLFALIVFAGYTLIWGIVLLLFWCSPLSTDALGYSLLFFYFILPSASFAAALLIGYNDLFGRFKWLFLLFFLVTTVLAYYLTFSLKNMIAFDKINYITWDTVLQGFLFGAVPAAVGMGTGFLIRLIKNKKRGEE